MLCMNYIEMAFQGCQKIQYFAKNVLKIIVFTVYLVNSFILEASPPLLLQVGGSLWTYDVRIS